MAKKIIYYEDAVHDEPARPSGSGRHRLAHAGGQKSREGHTLGMPGVFVFAVNTVGGDLAGMPAHQYGHCTVLYPGINSTPKKSLYLSGSG